MSNAITLTMKQGAEFLHSTVLTNIELALDGAPAEQFSNPFVMGSRGIGKTSIARQVATRISANEEIMEAIAEKFNCRIDADGIPHFDCRTTILMQYESTDFSGVPWVIPDEHGGASMIRATPPQVPMTGAGIWLLDEMSKVIDGNMINILSQALNERRLGEFRVSPGYSIVGTGNLRSEKTGDRNFPPHIWDRLTPIVLEAALEEFIEWGQRNGVDPTVLFFIKHYSMYFNKIEEKQTKHASPRSLVKAGARLSSGKFTGIQLHAGLVADIGEAAGSQLYQFAKIRDQLTDPEFALANPDGFDLPDKMEALYVLLAGVSARASRKNNGGFDRILQRVDAERENVNGRELSAFAFQSAYRRDVGILTGKHGAELAARFSAVMDQEID